MLWEDWINSASVGLNLTPGQSAIVLSFIFTLALVIVLLVGSRASEPGTTILGGFAMGITFFTYVEWLPRFLGVVLAFIFAGLLSYYWSNR